MIEFRRQKRSTLIIASALLAFTCPSISGGCRDSDSPIAGDTRTFDGIEFQWCPPGTFVMAIHGTVADEVPHAVTLTKGFWIGKYEVTQAQWLDIMGNNPSSHEGSLDKPVDTVSWEDCQDFIAKLNELSSIRQFRLPTEAQWEYACRAGAETEYYWGNDAQEVDILENAWYYPNSVFEQPNGSWVGDTHSVGQLLPNEWGIYDMSGNVWEHCQDWYAPYSSSPMTDPQGPLTGQRRIIRGGSIEDGAWSCRCSTRSDTRSPEARFRTLGLRLLCEE